MPATLTSPTTETSMAITASTRVSPLSPERSEAHSGRCTLRLSDSLYILTISRLHGPYRNLARGRNGYNRVKRAGAVDLDRRALRRQGSEDAAAVEGDVSGRIR